MSAGAKRNLLAARMDAEAFKALFPRSCYRRWEVAGSVRRCKDEVGDIEHVVLPEFGEVEMQGGLFAERKIVNLIWYRLDQLVTEGRCQKHVYWSPDDAIGEPAGRRRGDKYRGVDFRGFNHEIFTADAMNWGAQLLIRTGPADFSRNVVTRLKNQGVYRQQDGYLVRVETGQRVPVPDEPTYLEMADMAYIPPAMRH